MNQKLQPVRGTQDLLPEMCRAFRVIDDLAYQTAILYGYEEISTPLFEFSDVFHRTLGETSDMVSKETYTFLDRGGDSLTLRPEGTAGIARAFISNGTARCFATSVHKKDVTVNFTKSVSSAWVWKLQLLMSSAWL
jgi:histidyl-tRNA synthetase